MADELGLGEIGQYFDELALEAGAFAVEPFLADGVANRDAFEKFSLVEIGRGGQRFVITLGGEAFEFVHVDIDQFRYSG